MAAEVVHDLTAIADYLEDPISRPTLAVRRRGRARARPASSRTGPRPYCSPGLIGFVVLDICRHSAPQDQAYFRQSREERFGTTLEECRQATATSGCRRSATASTPLRRTARTAEVFSPATLPPMPTTSSSAPSNGRGRSAISSCWPADDPVARLARAAARRLWRPGPQEPRLWRLSGDRDDGDRRRVLLILHALSAVVWVGGMFFAHQVLRPAAALARAGSATDPVVARARPVLRLGVRRDRPVAG